MACLGVALAIRGSNTVAKNIHRWPTKWILSGIAHCRFMFFRRVLAVVYLHAILFVPPAANCQLLENRKAYPRLRTSSYSLFSISSIRSEICPRSAFDATRAMLFYARWTLIVMLNRWRDGNQYVSYTTPEPIMRTKIC